jgi:bifunctional non-homologous end joining protein LigD
MLPFLRGRPVMMQRLPEGLGGEVFYQKETPAYFPGWIRRVRVRKQGGTVNHVVCDDAATLVYLAAQACITPHVWLSRADRLDRPDRMILDVDPGPAGTSEARFAAGAVRDLLVEVGLTPYLMATGSRGYHVVVPLRRGDSFDEVRRVARQFMRILAEREPERLTAEPRKDARRGRLYLDYLRNAYAQTAVPPYAVRPRPGAPVAVPLAWEELSEAEPAGWSITTLPERLRRPDPWQGYSRHARSLDAARRWLESRGLDSP